MYAKDIPKATTVVGSETVFGFDAGGSLKQYPFSIFKGKDGTNGVPGKDGLNGADGLNGTDGLGVPAGGATGYVLTKVSAADNDTVWAPQIIATVYTRTIADTTPVTLSINDSMILSYTAAELTSLSLSLPLYVSTVEGVYEFILVGRTSGNSSGSTYTVLKPNDTNTGAFAVDYSRTANGGYASGTTTNFNITSGLARITRGTISTFTAHKNATFNMSSVEIGTAQQRIFDLRWQDTSTAWTSLGTLLFSETQAGTITVRRLV